MVTYWNRHPFLRGFNELPPWFYQPNMTDAYHPPLCYMIAAMYGSRNILEIGVAEGYGAWILGQAAKEGQGRYLGIDIVNTWDRPYEPYGCSMRRYYEGDRLPVHFLQADTKTLQEIPSEADGGLDHIDLAYIDGEHTTDAIIHEVYNLILPKLRGKGWGYICLDDIVDQGAEYAWARLRADEQFEAVGFHPNGGFGILRNMGPDQ